MRCGRKRRLRIHVGGNRRSRYEEMCTSCSCAPFSTRVGAGAGRPHCCGACPGGKSVCIGVAGTRARCKRRTASGTDAAACASRSMRPDVLVHLQELRCPARQVHRRRTHGLDLCRGHRVLRRVAVLEGTVEPLWSPALGGPSPTCSQPSRRNSSCRAAHRGREVRHGVVARTVGRHLRRARRLHRVRNGGAGPIGFDAPWHGASAGCARAAMCHHAGGKRLHGCPATLNLCTQRQGSEAPAPACTGAATAQHTLSGNAR